MNVFSILRNYADQSGGQFTDYDHSKGVVVVPVTKSRFQTILVVLKPGQHSGREIVVFTSKVCEYTAVINTRELLEENASFDYARFLIEEGYVKLEASCVSSAVTEELVREILEEVAKSADKFEMELTGQDIY